MSNAKRPVGVLVLCAKSDEISEIKAQFDWILKSVRARSQRFHEYLLPAPPGGGVDELLVLADCQDMGNTYAAAKTGYMIGTLRPNLSIFIGTAGSLDESKCGIGDVFVPTGCVSRYFDKICERGTKGFKTLSDDGGFKEFFFGRNWFRPKNALAVRNSRST